MKVLTKVFPYVRSNLDNDLVFLNLCCHSLTTLGKVTANFLLHHFISYILCVIVLVFHFSTLKTDRSYGSLLFVYYWSDR